MNETSPIFRRNLRNTLIVHLVLIGGLVIWEAFVPNHNDNTPTFIEVVTPAALLGDLPVGEGRGTGAHRAPDPEPVAVPQPPSGGSANLSADEQVAPPPVARPQPQPVSAPVSNPRDIAIPTKTTTAQKPKTTPKSTATASTSTRKNAKTATAGKTSKTTGTASARGPSADDFRKRFASALGSSEGGSALGDGRPAGGGDGSKKYGRLGHPDGTADGVVGGTGAGSPNWQYFLHVHDRMYEAWERPNQLMDKNLRTTVLLRISSDGTIDDVSLKRSSGNKVMDETALTAARRVARLNPPPAALMKGSEAPVTVDFELEG